MILLVYVVARCTYILGISLIEIDEKRYGTHIKPISVLPMTLITHEYLFLTNLRRAFLYECIYDRVGFYFIAAVFQKYKIRAIKGFITEKVNGRILLQIFI